MQPRGRGLVHERGRHHSRWQQRQLQQLRQGTDGRRHRTYKSTPSRSIYHHNMMQGHGGHSCDTEHVPSRNPKSQPLQLKFYGCVSHKCVSFLSLPYGDSMINDGYKGGSVRPGIRVQPCRRGVAGVQPSNYIAAGRDGPHHRRLHAGDESARPKGVRKVRCINTNPQKGTRSSLQYGGSVGCMSVAFTCISAELETKHTCS